MSFEKHLEANGVRLNDNNSQPKEGRTQKEFRKVIAAIRSAEGEANEEIRDANRKCRQAQEQVILLQDRLRVLESELRKYKVSDKLQQMEKLTVSDRQQLLDVA